MAIDNGGPAFPSLDTDEHRQVYSTNPGMTLRDWFAGMALQGILTNKVADTITASWRCKVADLAYGLADAMIATREEEDETE